MAIGLTTNKGWFQRAFVSVAQTAQADVELRSVMSSLSISGGSSDVDSIEVFGGKIAKPASREDYEISFDALVSSTRDLDWLAHGVAPTSVTITTSDATKKNRVTLLWTDATGITSAAMTVGTAGEAYRRSYAEVQVTSLEYNMDAGEELTASLTFKGMVEDETGGQNYRIDTKTSGAALSALGLYTSGTGKF
jgi:hypothetical protein